MEQYTALIVDIEASRQYSTQERNQLQDRIVGVIQALNLAFSSSLAKAVEFSGGDEVQGLFFDDLSAYLYFRLLEIHLLPHHVRGGIGTGTWITRVPARGSSAQDGPAYHIAREAIAQAHSLKTQSMCLGPLELSNITLNVLINTSLTLRKGLSPRQLYVLRMLESIYPLNYNGIIDTEALKPLLTAGMKDKASIIHTNIELVYPLTVIPEERIAIRNMVSALADYDGSTAQNISNLILKGNLLSIRAIDYSAACELLGRKGVNIQ